MSMAQFLDSKSSKTTPEHRLWFAVLLQYISDIKITCRASWEDCSYLNEACLAEKRRRFNGLNNTGLENICHVVGVDWKQFKKACTKIVNSKCPYHDELGQKVTRPGRLAEHHLVRKLGRFFPSTKRLGPLSKRGA